MAKTVGNIDVHEVPAILVEIARGFKSHGALYVLAIFTALSGQVVGYFYGRESANSYFRGFFTENFLNSAIGALGLFCAIFLLHSIFTTRPRKLWGHVTKTLRENIFSHSRLANGFHGVLLIALTLGGYSFWKQQVANIGGFAFDKALVKIDLMLHGGALPQELLDRIIAFPVMAIFIDAFYIFWFPIQLVVIASMSFQKIASFHRYRYLLTFGLNYLVIGVIAANLVSTAGPVYFERLNPGSDIYAHHMAILDQITPSFQLHATQWQDALWAAYISSPSYSYISAFPSMHVANAMLVFLISLKYGLLIRISGFLFLFLTLVGSIFLGWHYAADGYAAILIVLGEWWLAGKIANKQVH
ncbi:MAG: phosphatase PAP2 family protein [Pseudomonadota bacterium]